MRRRSVQVNADTRVIAVVAATLAVGIPLDALGPPGSQTLVSLWTWGTLLWIGAHSTVQHQRELAACVVLATLGELFLMEIWGLYHYRLLNLPLFIPPGHALVFTAAMRLSRRVPDWFPWTVFSASAVYLAYAASTGIDTQGLIWFTVLAGFMKWGREQNLYGVAFVIALVVETYGTSLGGWRYYPVEPWFGLTTTNPPVFVGAIYCTLEVMVRQLGRASASRLRPSYVPSSEAGSLDPADS